MSSVGELVATGGPSASATGLHSLHHRASTCQKKWLLFGQARHQHQPDQQQPAPTASSCPAVELPNSTESVLPAASSVRARLPIRPHPTRRVQGFPSSATFNCIRSTPVDGHLDPRVFAHHLHVRCSLMMNNILLLRQALCNSPCETRELVTIVEDVRKARIELDCQVTQPLCEVEKSIQRLLYERDSAVDPLNNNSPTFLTYDAMLVTPNPIHPFAHEAHPSAAKSV